MISTEKLGARLAELRKQRELTQADVASQLSMARTTLVALEKGERRPTSEELLRLSKVLEVPLHVLLREETVTGRISPRFRPGRIADELPELKEAVSRLERLAQRYVELERFNKVTRVPAPLESIETYRVVEGGPALDARSQGEEAARSVRSTLGLGEEPALQLDQRLEIEAGLRIFHLPLPPTVAAVFVWGEELGACVGLNPALPLERRRWALAHELGHFLRDPEAGDVLPITGPLRADTSELFAEAFAQEFLMPATGVSRRFNDRRRANGAAFSIFDLFALAEFYQVSFEAMTRRLEQLGLLRVGTLERLMASRPSSEEHAQAVPPDKVQPPTPSLFPERYVTLALRAFEGDELSEGDLADYLELDRIEARELYLSRLHHVMEDGSTMVTQIGQDILGAA